MSILVKIYSDEKKHFLLMAKRPVPGRVKTRLQPFLSETESAGLAESMLRDTVALGLSIGVDCTIGFDPPSEEDYFRQFEGVRLAPQPEGDLGERMSGVFETAPDSVSVMVGTDSPELSATDIRRAFQLLESDADVVLGPTFDGGFYLVGFHAFERRLFEGVPWSTDSTLESTIRNAEALGLRVKQVSTRHDLDEPSDLVGFYQRMLNRKEVGGNVENWFREHVQLFQT